MKKKKICVQTLLIAAATTIALYSNTAIFGKNKSYSYEAKRGMDNITCLKNRFNWSANKDKIVDVDKKQVINGLFIQKGGIKKVKSLSGKKHHTYDCITRLKLGGQIPLIGFDISYGDEFTDRVTIRNTGKASTLWDI